MFVFGAKRPEHKLNQTMASLVDHVAERYNTSGRYMIIVLILATFTLGFCLGSWFEVGVRMIWLNGTYNLLD